MKQNNIEFEIDRDLTISNACNRCISTLVCSKETLNQISEHNWGTGDTYKGHPIIIDNNLKLGEYKILKEGEQYAE